MRRVQARAARGAAAVELALSMLVIIPVFLYSLFLDDLLRHALDAQETALSTVWDYVVQDYAKAPQGGEKFAGFGMVQGYARLTYCDHESGIDSFETGPQPRECGDEEIHHQEVVSHACWLNPGSQQVECTLNAGGAEVGAYGVSMHQSYMDEYGKGGLIRCSARIGVQNYLLQRSVFAQFSKVDLAKDKQDRGAGVHNNARGGTYQADPGGVAGNVYLLPWERLSVLTDTWALTEPADIRPGAKSGELFERVSHLYKHQENQGYSDMSQAAADYVDEAIDNEILADNLSLDGKPAGDDPREPSMAIKPFGDDPPEESITQQGSSQSYFNSEWRDWDQDGNQKTRDARSTGYMGCKPEEPC